MGKSENKAPRKVVTDEKVTDLHGHGIPLEFKDRLPSQAEWTQENGVPTTSELGAYLYRP